MSVGGISNSTDGASATALQNPMQLGRTGFVVQAPVHVRMHTTSHETRGEVSMSTLTLEAFAALDDCDAEEALWSPAQAFQLRREGRIGSTADLPTLHHYLTSPGFVQDGANAHLSAKAHKLPKPHAPITVYGMPCAHQKTPCGVVMPGSYVAISKSLARLMAKLPSNVPAHMNSTVLYADELVYQGDAYGFVYVPRSVQLGFERYQMDLQRALGAASPQLPRPVSPRN